MRFSARSVLPESVDRMPRAAACHDRAEPETLSGSLRLRYRAGSAVHVGTGAFALWPADAAARLGADGGRGGSGSGREVAVRAGARVQDRPGLPGSTLRGSLRERHARLTRSCVGRASGDPGFRAERSGPPALEPCRGREVCPTCALFGTFGLRGRLRVSDATTPAGTRFTLIALPTPTRRPRPPERGGRPGEGRGGDRRGGPPPRPQPAAAAPFLAEALAIDTVVELDLGVRNLRLEELGALIGAIGLEPFTAVTCGSGRSAGLGRLYLEGLEVDLYGPGGTPAEAHAHAWRRAFEQGRDRWLAGEAGLVQELGGDT
jgi:hypothetical protein